MIPLIKKNAFAIHCPQILNQSKIQIKDDVHLNRFHQTPKQGKL